MSSRRCISYRNIHDDRGNIDAAAERFGKSIFYSEEESSSFALWKRRFEFIRLFVHKAKANKPVSGSKPLGYGVAQLFSVLLDVINHVL